MELVEKYWTKVDEVKRYQRYDPTTAKGKAAKKRSSRASEAASTPAKRGRSSTATVQLSSDEDDAPAEKPNSKRKGRQSNASVASAFKKAKKAASPEANLDEEEEEVEEVEEKPKKGGKKVKADEAEAEEEEEIAEGEGYQSGRAHHDWEELEYADKKNWEDLVEAIETVEQDGERIKFWVVWKDLDNVASWVPNDVCKERCPLKVRDKLVLNRQRECSADYPSPCCSCSSFTRLTSSSRSRAPTSTAAARRTTNHPNQPTLFSFRAVHTAPLLRRFS